MSLNDYMLKTFPGLELKQPLFYNWNIGIRFELGVYRDCTSVYGEDLYLEGVYKRAITLFKSLHSPNDDIYIVVNVHDYGSRYAFKKKLNIFSKYIKDKSVLFKLHENTIPYLYPENDDEGICKTHRFTLKCKAFDLKYIPMLKAICNIDMGRIRPKISNEVYFVNATKNTIFQVYDDRGCDLVATTLESIVHIYKTYNDWILDYNRDEIDKVFDNG